MSAIDVGHAGVPSSAIESLLRRERTRYAAARPAGRAHRERAGRHWLNGVPLHWMTDWALPFPLVVDAANGAELTDIDGLRYADFCLGDTGAMFGHSPAPVAEALRRQADRGYTCMLPSEHTAAVGELLAARFGLPHWQMTQSASDANRAVLRWARAVTGRQRILVFDGCYHGALEDTMVSASAHAVIARPGQIGSVADHARFARVVDFNDLAALEAQLAHGDVACVLAEPVMTNAGMVLPHEDFWPAARSLCTQHGTLLAIDETHTLSSGPHGHARRLGLAADFLVIGKAIAGGVPCAVYGFSGELGARMNDVLLAKPAGHSGMGTTLAANPLATAALHACLAQVMTEAAYTHMIALATRLRDGIVQLIERHRLPWNVANVGARCEINFQARPARNARESLAAAQPQLERALHLYLLNRGVLITPFHNMMLVSPATTALHVEQLLQALDACCTELLA